MEYIDTNEKFDLVTTYADETCFIFSINNQG